MSKPSEKMTAEEFRKSFCTTNPTAPTSNRVTARQFTGQELVEIRVHFPDGQPGHEIHYVVKGSEIEKFWRDRAAELETKQP